MFLLIIYHFFFWQESLGLNLLLFHLLLSGSLWLLYPKSWRSGTFRWSAIFTLVAVLMVVWHNSLISKVAYFSSAWIMLAFAHERKLGSVIYAAAYSATTWIITLWMSCTLPLAWIHALADYYPAWKQRIRQLRLTVIPMICFAVFFLIFREANPIFDQMNQRASLFLHEMFIRFFAQISLAKLFFLLMGAFLIATYLFRWEIAHLLDHESKQNNEITRQRNHYRGLGISLNTLALKNEYRVGLLSMFLINALLLVINLIDINWLWLGFDYGLVDSFKDLVHKGTYMLILSILLSVGILLYFFRNNLNFYPKNHLLKKFAHLWIAQNVVLTYSVMLRTYYYIHEYGLAYKRIGVLIFLLLTLFGLWSLSRKIQNRQSTYWLLKKNTWAVYAMLVGMSLIDWDMLIVRYNLKHYERTGQIGVPFMIHRADKTLMLLDQYKFAIDREGNPTEGGLFWYESKRALVENRIENFLEKQSQTSWLSWNYAENSAYQYLKKHYQPKE